MEEPLPIARACLACGTWMTLQAGSGQVYCSPECSRENLHCQVCGRFFAKGTGHMETESEVYCYSECAADEPRYQQSFKEKA